MILNVAFSILVPDDRVIVVRQLEQFRDVFSSCFDTVESFLAEHGRQMPLDSGNSSSGNMIAEDPEG